MNSLTDLDRWTLLAILSMAALSYLCRVLGVILMARVPLTPRLRRGLSALPGSIIVATVAPLAIQGGTVAMAAIGAGFGVMMWRRNELLALAVGMGVAIAWRAVVAG